MCLSSGLNPSPGAPDQGGTLKGKSLWSRKMEKASQVIDLRGLYLVGDTWIEHVTPAV